MSSLFNLSTASTVDSIEEYSVISSPNSQDSNSVSSGSLSHTDSSIYSDSTIETENDGNTTNPAPEGLNNASEELLLSFVNPSDITLDPYGKKCVSTTGLLHLCGTLFGESLIPGLTKISQFESQYESLEAELAESNRKLEVSNATILTVRSTCEKMQAILSSWAIRHDNDVEDLEAARRKLEIQEAANKKNTEALKAENLLINEDLARNKEQLNILKAAHKYTVDDASSAKRDLEDMKKSLELSKKMMKELECVKRELEIINGKFSSLKSKYENKKVEHENYRVKMETYLDAYVEASVPIAECAPSPVTAWTSDSEHDSDECRNKVKDACKSLAVLSAKHDRQNKKYRTRCERIINDILGEKTPSNDVTITNTDVTMIDSAIPAKKDTFLKNRPQTSEQASINRRIFSEHHTESTGFTNLSSSVAYTESAFASLLHPINFPDIPFYVSVNTKFGNIYFPFLAPPEPASLAYSLHEAIRREVQLPHPGQNWLEVFGATKVIWRAGSQEVLIPITEAGSHTVVEWRLRAWQRTCPGGAKVAFV